MTYCSAPAHSRLLDRVTWSSDRGLVPVELLHRLHNLLLALQQMQIKAAVGGVDLKYFTIRMYFDNDLVSHTGPNVRNITGILHTQSFDPTLCLFI